MIAVIPYADLKTALVMLVEAYEARQPPIAPPDPVETIKFRMEQAGLTPKDR
jgi:HTH-type transcriptional regulator/antitoxin HigA